MKHLSTSNKFVAWTSILSFIIGSLFLLSFLIFKEIVIAILGYFYLIIAVIINLAVFIGIITGLLIYKNNQTQTLKILSWQLLNIPIAALYYYIVTLVL